MSSNYSLVNDSGTDNKATGEIDLHVDSKKSLKSKMSGGGRRRTRRRTHRRTSSAGNNTCKVPCGGVPEKKADGDEVEVY